jgi:hypothetical protein
LSGLLLHSRPSGLCAVHRGNRPSMEIAAPPMHLITR